MLKAKHIIPSQNTHHYYASLYRVEGWRLTIRDVTWWFLITTWSLMTLFTIQGCGQKTEDPYPHVIAIDSIEGSPDKGYDFLLRFSHSQTGEPAPAPAQAGMLEAVADNTVLGLLTKPVPVTDTDMAIMFHAAEDAPDWALLAFSKGARDLVKNITDRDASVFLSLPAHRQDTGNEASSPNRPLDRLTPTEAASLLESQMGAYQQQTNKDELNRKPAIMDRELMQELVSRLSDSALNADNPRRFKCMVILVNGLASGPIWREITTMATAAGIHLHILPIAAAGTPAQPRLESRNAIYPVSSTPYQLAGNTEALVKIIGTLYAAGLHSSQTEKQPILLQNPGVLVRLPGDGWELFPAPAADNSGLFLRVAPLSQSPDNDNAQCHRRLLTLSANKEPLYPDARQLMLLDRDGRKQPFTFSHSPDINRVSHKDHPVPLGNAHRNMNIMIMAEAPGTEDQVRAVRESVGAFIGTMEVADRLAFYGVPNPNATGGFQASQANSPNTLYHEGNQAQPTARPASLFQTTAAEWSKSSVTIPLLQLGNTTLLQQALHAAHRLAAATDQLTGQKVLMVFSGPIQLNAAANARNRIEILNEINEHGVQMIWVAYDPWNDRDAFKKELERSGAMVLVAQKPDQMKELSTKAHKILHGERIISFKCPTPKASGNTSLLLKLEHNGGTATTQFNVE